MQSDSTPCCVGGWDVLEIQGVGGRVVCVCVSTPTAAAEEIAFQHKKKEHYSHACVMAYLLVGA